MQLGRELASGGEGKIMEIIGQPKLVAKIFHDPSKHTHLEKAYPHLNKLSDKFVKPIDLIRHNGQLIGFTMDLLDLTKWVPISALQYDKYCTTHNISDRTYLLKLVCDGLKDAHNIGVTVGDLNPENIMTDNRQIKYIDVSPYKTPVTPHNNILQPEIVDWLHNANVSQESDYFSLAVSIFQILTSVHPFKGVHPDYNTGDAIEKLKRRMIDKVSVLSGDQKLIIPKSYRQIQSGWLKDQFYQIFQNGDRFLLSIDKPIQVLITKVDPIGNDKIKIVKIFDGQIGYYFSYKDRIVINSEIYEFPGRGWGRKISNGYFLADNIVMYEDKKLKHNGTELDFSILGLKTKQIGNIVFCLDGDELYKIDVNKIYKSHIDVTKEQVYGASFKFGQGIVQNFSKSSVLQVNLGNKIISTTSQLRILDFIQCGNFASIKFQDNQIIKYGYINLLEDKNKVLREVDSMRTIAQKGDMIFEPGDGVINILRAYDFQKIGELEANVVTTESALFINTAGIVIINNDAMYILNTN